MDQSASVLPLQRPKDVSVTDIEKELDKIWSRGESVAARAATFNLVVYESLDTSSLAPSSPVEAIATQNPCRVIDLRAKPGESSDAAIEAQVAAYCPVNRDRRSLVCCEYITLQAPESAFLRMCSTVESLLIHDLSTYLWWHGDLDLNSRVFQQLVNLTDRVVVDSRDFQNPEEDLQELRQLVQEGKHCGDLNWLRLASWQELAAQAFDPPDRRQVLELVDRVTLDYKATNPSQAFLCLGWLASRLGWTPVQRVRRQEYDYLIDRVTLQGENGREIQAELGAVPLTSEATAAGDLIGLRLTSTDTSADACTVLCSETTGCMRMETMGGAQACHIRQVSPVEHDTVDVLLERQLQRVGADLLFEESLQMAAQILKLES